MGFTVVVPDSIPQMKVAKIEALGGGVIKVPYAKWWKTILTCGHIEEADGATSFHCSDINVLAGGSDV